MTSIQDLPTRAETPATPQGSPASTSDDEQPTGRRSLLVGTILVGIVIATLTMVGFIWYRWHGVREPTSSIVVEGDESLDGTIITIRGGPTRQITTSLKASNQYNAPV